MSTSQATQASGAVVTATRLNNYPQGVLTVATSTSNSSATSSTTELDVLTASAVTLATATRRIKITWHCNAISSTAANDTFIVRIKEGSTTLQESSFFSVSTSAMSTGGCDFFAIVDSPTAASHTYKVTIQRSGGSGAATVRASSTGPMTLVVEDCGISP